MVEDLARIVGAANVLPGDDPRYVADQTAFSAVQGSADAVVLPADAEEVAAVVSWCAERGVPVVPRGGGTGWAGGAVPLGTGVVVGLERLGAVHAVDPLQWRMTVGAGRHHGDRPASRPRERPVLPSRSRRRRDLADRRQRRHERRRAALLQVRRHRRVGDGPGGRARERRRRPRRRVGAQGRRGLRPARPPRRLGGHARNRHGRLAAADPRAGGLLAGRRLLPGRRGRRRGRRAPDGGGAGAGRDRVPRRGRAGARGRRLPRWCPRGRGVPRHHRERHGCGGRGRARRGARGGRGGRGAASSTTRRGCGAGATASASS